MDWEFCILRMTSSSDMSGGCHHWAEATNLLYWLQQRQTQLTRADTRHKKEGTSATFLYLFASTASRLIITLYLYFEIFTSFKLNFPKQVHDASSCKEKLFFLICFFVEYTCISFFTKNISQNHTQLIVVSFSQQKTDFATPNSLLIQDLISETDYKILPTRFLNVLFRASIRWLHAGIDIEFQLQFPWTIIFYSIWTWS